MWLRAVALNHVSLHVKNPLAAFLLHRRPGGGISPYLARLGIPLRHDGADPGLIRWCAEFLHDLVLVGLIDGAEAPLIFRQ